MPRASAGGSVHLANRNGRTQTTMTGHTLRLLATAAALSTIAGTAAHADSWRYRRCAGGWAAPGRPGALGDHHRRPDRNRRTGYRHRHARQHPRAGGRRRHHDSKSEDKGKARAGMITPTLHFSREEYAARIAKMRETMEARGIDLMICSDPSNMAWLTGYDGWSFYVHQCVLLALDGEPVWFGRGQDANGAQAHRLHGREQHRRLPRPLRAVHRAPSDGLSVRRRSRSAAGPSADRRRDGQLLVLAPPPMRRCRSTCRTRSFIDATALVNWQRAVKSPRRSSTTCARPRASSRRCTRASST